MTIRGIKGSISFIKDIMEFWVSSVVDCVNKIRVLLCGLEGVGIQPLNTTSLSILMTW